MRSSFVVFVALVVAGCAPPGYEYDTGSFTAHPVARPSGAWVNVSPPPQQTAVDRQQRQAFQDRAMQHYLATHPGSTSLDFYRYRSFCMKYAEWVTRVSAYRNGNLPRAYAENWARQESANDAPGLDPETASAVETILLGIVGGIYTGTHMTNQEANDDCLMGHLLRDSDH